MRYLYKKTWNEFRSTGLLWWVNRTLHLFGWAIVFDFEKDKKTIKEVFPARCKFRGFGVKNEEEGFIKLTKYLKKNVDRLEKDTLL